MEHIEQLKKIRSDAIARLRASADFKLAGKLGALIVELGEMVDDHVDYAEPKNKGSKPFVSIFDKEKEEAEGEQASKGMVDELVAEIDNDAKMLSVSDKSRNEEKIGPMIKPSRSRSTYTNGASH